MFDHIPGGTAAQAFATQFTTLATAALLAIQLRRELRQLNWRKFLRAPIKRGDS